MFFKFVLSRVCDEELTWRFVMLHQSTESWNKHVMIHLITVLLKILGFHLKLSWMFWLVDSANMIAVRSITDYLLIRWYAYRLAQQTGYCSNIHINYCVCDFYFWNMSTFCHLTTLLSADCGCSNYDVVISRLNSL